jgi:hypothetical protein
VQSLPEWKLLASYTTRHELDLDVGAALQNAQETINALLSASETTPER